MMAKTNPSTIILKCAGTPRKEEFPLAPISASGVTAITPGMLVETVAGEVRPHSTQGGDAERMFAIEGLNEDANSKTLGDIDTDYDDDNAAVKVWFPRPGDIVYALLGAGQSVAAEGLVQSASDGYLMAYAAAAQKPEKVVGRATEAVDNSAGTSAARVRVRVI
jgi:hypothetical protein